ncbi:MBL fold metallo-hydrolase [Actinocorallia longicatena]|uniref:MBL fold metallo-hydrolase n=1 Tax=Actinocorallia longicatena TaxID=111803 RepID=A0ABP6PXW4_9ACTN
MIEVTGVVQKQAWLDKVLPPVERVRDGLWSVPVPLPDNPLRYVLVYVLEAPGGVVLVDAGWDTAEAWAALNDGLAVAGYAITDVLGVLVTHLHPDHYGLAGRVREASGAWVALHSADARLLRDRYRDYTGLIEAIRRQMREHGVPEEDAGQLADASKSILPLVRHTEPEVILEDGKLAPVPGWELRTVWTPGHSPGHVCFHDVRGGLLLSGDHVLPRISPAVVVHPQQPGDALGDFFASLEKVRGLRVEEVLPAHEYRFAGLDARVAELLDHHEERLTEIEGAVGRAAEGPTAWELATRLTWSRPWEQIQPFMRRTAMLETLAHLVMLEAAGRVAKHDGGARRGPVRWVPGPAAQGSARPVPR